MTLFRISTAALSCLVATRSCAFAHLVIQRLKSSAPSLLLQPCNASDPLQAFKAVSETIQWSGGDAPLCITFDATLGYDAPLLLTPCIQEGAANQSWVFAGAPNSSFSNPTGFCAGSAGACLQWSGQETDSCSSTPPALGPGCRIGTWPTSYPTSWNNQFAFEGNPGPGAIEAVWASADGPSPSGQCATVTFPQPPVPPTPDILAWSKKEVMCLYGKRQTVHFSFRGISETCTFLQTLTCAR